MKPPQEAPQHIIPTSPLSTSTPHQHRHMQPIGGTFPRSAAGGQMIGSDMTLPYHVSQCPHSHQSVPLPDHCKNYVPDSSLSHFRPLVSNYEHAHSSSPSTVQSDVSVTDSEFHTIRECLGDFKNNNLPDPGPNPQLPVHHSNTLPYPHHHNVGRCVSAPFTRTLWTPDGRPYEAVTSPCGVEHIYQPLERIYEEPHIWRTPLPNPKQ